MNSADDFSRLELSLPAATRNYRYFRSLLEQETKMLVLVKANAYGHGAVEFASMMQQAGADYLAVALPVEGIELRRAGISLPILVLTSGTDFFEEMIQYNLEPSIPNLETLKALVAVLEARGAKDFPIHIKLDTGMHRLGFMPDELQDLFEFLEGCKAVHVVSVFSHLAVAEDVDEEHRDNHDRWHDAGREEPRRGVLRHDRIDDDDDARRDKYAEAASRGDDSRAHVERELVPPHLRYGDRCHRGGAGGAGAADGAESRAGAHRGERDAARQAPQPLVCGVEQPAADSRVEGDLPHEDEKRYDAEVVFREVLVCDADEKVVRGVWIVRGDSESDGADKRKREADWHARKEQEKQHNAADYSNCDK